MPKKKRDSNPSSSFPRVTEKGRQGGSGKSLPCLKARTEPALSSSKLLAPSGSRLEIKIDFKLLKNGKGLSQAIGLVGMRAGQFNFLSSVVKDPFWTKQIAVP